MYYFIVNPNSRSGAGQKVWDLLKKELELRQTDYTVFMTKYAGHAVQLSKKISGEASLEKPVYIVAIGGDGTIQEVLTGIIAFEHVVFGYIPIGSGNDFCRGMGLPRTPIKALDVILSQNRIVRMDVPVIQEGKRISRFGVSTGIGFDAAVCRDVGITPLKKYLNRLHLGKLVYLLVALKQLLFTAPCSMSISMDGGRIQQYEKVYFITVMNQKYEGGGFCFCPNASPFDGFLDVLVVEGFHKLRLLICLPAALWGRHTHFKGIHIFRCRHIDIRSEASLPVHKDGEARNMEREFSVSLMKKTLKVILPVI